MVQDPIAEGIGPASPPEAPAIVVGPASCGDPRRARRRTLRAAFLGPGARASHARAPASVRARGRGRSTPWSVAFGRRAPKGRAPSTSAPRMTCDPRVRSPASPRSATWPRWSGRRAGPRFSTRPIPALASPPPRQHPAPPREWPGPGAGRVWAPWRWSSDADRASRRSLRNPPRRHRSRPRCPPVARTRAGRLHGPSSHGPTNRKLPKLAIRDGASPAGSGARSEPVGRRSPPHDAPHAHATAHHGHENSRASSRGTT